MHVKSPGVKICSTITYVSSLTFIIDGVNTIAPACNYKCVEITYSNFINFLLAKLFKLPDVLTFCIFISASNSKRSVDIRTCKLKLIYNSTLISGSLKLYLYKQLKLLKITHQHILNSLSVCVIFICSSNLCLLYLIHCVCFKSHEFCQGFPNIFFVEEVLDVH